jgi:single-stranded-DNA-specific exonuclease
MESPDIALEVLSAPSLETAMPLTKHLAQLNSRRRNELEQGLDEVMSQLSQRSSEDRIIQKVGDWHLGIIGLISGRLTQEFARPSLVYSRMQGDGFLKASGRSVGGFDITAAIAAHSELLEEFGGHREAAGLTIREENLQQFQERLEAQARETIKQQQLVPELVVDAEVDANALNLRLVEELATLEPFGMANREPILALMKAQIMRISILKGDRHLKLWLRSHGRVFEALWWNQGRRERDFHYGQLVDAAFRLQTNKYNGQTKVQLILQDLQ